MFMYAAFAYTQHNVSAGTYAWVTTFVNQMNPRREAQRSINTQEIPSKSVDDGMSDLEDAIFEI